MTVTDSELAFYESVIADSEGKSLSDLRYAYYSGVLSGEIAVVPALAEDPEDGGTYIVVGTGE